MSGAGFPSLLLAHAKLLAARRPGLRPGATLPRLERSARGVVADPSWLARYRRVCGLADDGALPTLAPQLMAAPLHLALLADREFPIAAMGIVHVANRTEERTRLPAGAALDLVARVAGSREAALGVEFDLVTEATLEGAIVWRTTTTALARRRGEKGGARSKREETAAGVEGGALRSAIVRVAEDTGRRYARIAGDLNPIHQRAWMARPFGFRTAIVHGTWTVARALAECADDLPAWPRVAEVRFRKPVPLPSSVVVSAWRRDDGALDITVSPPKGGTAHVEIRVAPLRA
ncbi:MAG: MaoC/PaaZ C-terminal domain-containing protein [Deltaproteobacteria bacterium]|nr:MaoC/PaaZ C-terminal domain-containing protein [Myxococcales bacterium]MDP3216219.1 MaoC/PaaZ C-terminal domain-containing protein [Deltaproteobacteria bacterium]